MERDLRDVSECTGADAFVAWIDAKIDSAFTNDFWSITLPDLLETAGASGPAHYAYYAALNLLDARVLFSQKRIFDLLDPSLNATRAGAEKHHLFPKKYLADLGFSQLREQNQLANYALVEWDDNATISASAPADYAPKHEARFSDSDLNRMHYWHALPVNWHRMEYVDFLKARRKLIAKVIQDGYRKLHSKDHNEPELRTIPVDEIVARGEGNKVEFKSTLRVNLHTNENDVRMEHTVLKTIAAFLNTNGGVLVIGVDDSGSALGIDADKFPNEDKMNLHLVNIIKARLGTQHMVNVQPQFSDFGGKRVLVLECKVGYAPAYLKRKDGSEQFYVRTGAATSELLPSQIHTYVTQRF